MKINKILQAWISKVFRRFFNKLRGQTVFRPVAACGGLWQRIGSPLTTFLAGRRARQAGQAGRAGRQGRQGRQAGRAGGQEGEGRRWRREEGAGGKEGVGRREEVGMEDTRTSHMLELEELGRKMQHFDQKSSQTHVSQRDT